MIAGGRSIGFNTDRPAVAGFYRHHAVVKKKVRQRGFDTDDVHAASVCPVLACSKYSIIGEPKQRKKRPSRSVWTLPKMSPAMPRGFITELDPEDSPRTNTIDVRSIYGQKSKIHYIPTEPSREDTVFATPRPREDSVILPPLQISKRRGDVKLDANSMAEKRYVMQDQTEPKVLRRIFRDHVAFPTAYRPYFRYRKRRERFAQSVFPADEFWENNRRPVHCSRCIHQSTATLHFCDVLGKRFCRFCSEMTDRSFSHAYERSRLLVASPHKSPTLKLLQEPSFIGVRKVVITKTAKELNGERQSDGDNSRDPATPQ
nr:hypothetical protein BaRGS_022697 [Batillaria attramentaria]